jgi:hypothetical protein
LRTPNPLCLHENCGVHFSYEPIDLISMRIAIIGGGFSGSAVAINILRRSVDEILLTLLERGDVIGTDLLMILSVLFQPCTVVKTSHVMF